MSHEKSLEDFIIRCVGGLSVILCIASMIPQIYKMYKTKRTNDLSMKSYFINLLGITLIQIYAGYFNLWELFIPNLLSFILILLQMLMKKCYDTNYGILDYQDLPGKEIQVNFSPSPNSDNSDMSLDNPLLTSIPQL